MVLPCVVELVLILGSLFVDQDNILTYPAYKATQTKCLVLGAMALHTSAVPLAKWGQ